ncbi:MAG: hypothetical protein DSM106950_26940 [Stigonema ocellatum SAG 48.90 = DSM 106950]|nr:hypothetical protein [Stigonema ocellatum SAG 48.90 = DSM 106950]
MWKPPLRDRTPNPPLNTQSSPLMTCLRTPNRPLKTQSSPKIICRGDRTPNPLLNTQSSPLMTCLRTPNRPFKTQSSPLMTCERRSPIMLLKAIAKHEHRNERDSLLRFVKESNKEWGTKTPSP